MLEPLDGPSIQGTLTVTSTVVQELKVGGSVLEERKVITLYPDNRLYVYFGDGVNTPSSSDVSTHGIQIVKSQLTTLEASDRQFVYVLAVSTTVDLKVAERA